MTHQHDQLLADSFSRLILGTCKYPDQCKIDVDFEARRIRVLPHMADYPILVGSSGRQVNALKYLANKGGFDLLLDESFVGQREPKQAFEYRPETGAKSLQLLGDFCNLLFEQCPTIASELLNDDKVQGQSLLVRIEPVNDDEDSRMILAALGEVFHPMSYHQGQLLKVRLAKKSKDSKDQKHENLIDSRRSD